MGSYGRAVTGNGEVCSIKESGLQGREDGKDRKDLLQCLLCVIGNGFPIHDVSHDILCGC